MDSCRENEDPVRVSPHFLTLFISLSLYLFVSVPLSLRAESPGSAPIEVGPQKQLFLDDYLVASTTNIFQRIHPAEKSKSNPVILQTEPWEDPLNILYGSVIRDGEKYKAWYKSGPGVSYAVSDDGIHSTGQSITKSKPIHRDSLDSLIEWEGGAIKGAVVLRIALKNACLYALWCD